MRCQLPREPGVYVIIVMVSKTIEISTRRGKRFTIPCGIYLYLGSARGGGGIRGRVLRHLRRSGDAFWHVDYLLRSPSAKILGIMYGVYKDSRDHEAELALKLRKALPGIKGFGCSDKPRDYSHLYLCGYTEDECLRRIASIADLVYCSLDAL